MKFYISIFLVISSCTILNNDRAQKIYICGDHVCNSKKERNEYFKNNEDLKKIKKLAKIRIKEGENVITKPKNIKSEKKPKITLIRICKDLDECDIDEVTKIIFNKANEKKFPNLTFK